MRRCSPFWPGCWQHRDVCGRRWWCRATGCAMSEPAGIPGLLLLLQGLLRRYRGSEIARAPKRDRDIGSFLLHRCVHNQLVVTKRNAKAPWRGDHVKFRGYQGGEVYLSLTSLHSEVGLVKNCGDGLGHADVGQAAVNSGSGFDWHRCVCDGGGGPRLGNRSPKSVTDSVPDDCRDDAGRHGGTRNLELDVPDDFRLLSCTPDSRGYWRGHRVGLSRREAQWSLRALQLLWQRRGASDRC